ncbi:class I SAM-dependent methyltransferase [Thermofilum sp.]|uniref:class I SAM-dependent methyltransferase n=1 Tax=Thermofilum sp. TaxID=1961369 RepID=UPI0031620EA5
MDIENAQELPFPHGFFNVIVFSDILEHLKRPDIVLLSLKKYLSLNGFIIASIPNVVRIENRLKFLFGKFDYRESGILNKGHLRFLLSKPLKDFLKVRATIL